MAKFRPWRRHILAVIRTKRPIRQAVKRLLDNADALAHFLNADHVTVVHVAVLADRNIELKVLIAAVRHRLADVRSEEHTSELQSRENLVCRLLLEKKKKNHE